MKKKKLSVYNLGAKLMQLMTQKVTIYTLRCPITDKIYYVGATTQPLEVRAKSRRSLPTDNWLSWKRAWAIVEPLEETIHALAQQRETYWIEQLKAWGFPLENKITKSSKGGYPWWAQSRYASKGYQLPALEEFLLIDNPQAA